MTTFSSPHLTMLGPGQMCAGGGVGDSCAGDSGSALMLELIPEGRQFDPRLVQVTSSPPPPPPPPYQSQ